MAETMEEGLELRQQIGLWLGPVLAGVIYLLGAPETLVAQLDSPEAAQAAWTVLALLILMAVWWVSEAIPIPVTALLPMVILPLAGVQTISVTAAQYMNPIVVLLLGGFIVAKAIERWNLHTRIALSVVARVGDKPTMLVAGFMAAAALLSMWISNTATAIMLTPIALSVAAAVQGPGETGRAYTYALLLAVAWACSIGGLGTPIGTPTNLIVIEYLNENMNFDIGFDQWMLLGVPTVLIMVPLGWFVLTRWAFSLKGAGGTGNGAAVVRERLAALGKLTVPERRTLIVFAVIATLWVFRRPLTGLDLGGFTPFAGITDHVTAILGVLLCFLIPAGGEGNKGKRLLDWDTAETIPWGVVLLFGGGMSLAFAIRGSGLGDWIGGELSVLAVLPTIIMALVLTTFVVFLTEVTSNVATASALMPVLGAIALSTGTPIELLALPLALSASCAFMLPMATGPNAVVYASRMIDLPTMAKAGLRLNLLAIIAITLISVVLGPLVL